MRFLVAVSCALLATFLSSNAQAITPYPHAVQSYDTFGAVGLASVYASNYTTISIEGHDTVGDGGEGIFVYDPNRDADCPKLHLHYQGDGGVTLVDKDENCFRRVFSGPVDIRWYGAKDAATPACYDSANTTYYAACDSTSLVAAAFSASKAWGDGGVTTNGRSIAIVTGFLDILPTQYLTCAGPPGGMRVQGQGGSIIPYYSLPNSLILNPSYSVRSPSGQSRLSDCLIRPSWYFKNTAGTPAIPFATPRDVINAMHLFSGTAFLCQAESCTVERLFIFGFDVCAQFGTTSQGTPRSVAQNLTLECNMPLVFLNQGGGIKVSDVSVFPYLESRAKDSSGAIIGQSQWNITKVKNPSGTDNIRLTVVQATGASLTPVAGDTVLVNGLGPATGYTAIKASGTVTAGSTSITNIPASTGNQDGWQDIGFGYVVTGGCLNTVSTIFTVISVGDDGTGQGTGTATISSSAPAGCSGKQSLSWTDTAASTPGGNGLWQISATGTDTDGFYVDLKGASWNGPAFNGANWIAGSNVIKLYDTTNVAAGSYLCTTTSSSSAPFCTPPSDFMFASITSTSLGGIGTGLGTFAITGSLAGWPQTGVFKVGSEIICYQISSSTQLKATCRGYDGTTVTTHSGSVTLTAAAPQVIAVVPTPNENAVMVSTKAQQTRTNNLIAFANDVTVYSNALGTMFVNTGYTATTASQVAGPPPDGVLTVYAGGTSSSSSNCGGSLSTLTLAANGFKVHEGMKVTDLTNSTNISNGTVCSISGNTVMIYGTVSSFTNDKLQFSGCGYPVVSSVAQFWLGNCVATALFNSGGNGDDVSQGMTCEYFHSWGFRVAMHMLDGPASRCTNFLASGGGGAGQTNDPFSAGLWFTGASQKSQFTNGRLEAQLSILNVPSNERDGVQISNTQFGGSVVNGANGNLILAATQEKGSNGRTTFTYHDSQAVGLNMTGNSHPDATYYTDDPATVTTTVYCSANQFAGGTCAHPKGTPSCVSGCGSGAPCPNAISGTDGSFDICTDNMSTMIVVTLAGNYATQPVCTVSANAAVAAAPSLVDAESYGTTVTFSLAAAARHLYASCRAPT